MNAASAARQHSLGAIRLLVVLVACFATTMAIAAPHEKLTTAPERVIHEFYQWYVQALLDNKNPLEQDRATLRRYVTTRLIREIDHMRKGPDGLDGDYFVDAQDFDRDWAKNISVSNVEIQGARATATVALKGREAGTRTLRVTLAQEAGAWKVDKVTGH
jgi:hypothetical protein